MASYSATMIKKGLTGTPMSGTGSFENINIDGRLSLVDAIETARKVFKSEAQMKNSEYLGFAIERTKRFVEYRNPKMVDTELSATQVEYLL